MLSEMTAGSCRMVHHVCMQASFDVQGASTSMLCTNQLKAGAFGLSCAVSLHCMPSSTMRLLDSHTIFNMEHLLLLGSCATDHRLCIIFRMSIHPLGGRCVRTQQPTCAYGMRGLCLCACRTLSRRSSCPDLHAGLAAFCAAQWRSPWNSHMHWICNTSHWKPGADKASGQHGMACPLHKLPVAR